MKEYFALLFVAVGVLLIALAVPLIRRRVKPNRLYGLRVPATFADEYVWFEANARSGRDLLNLGLTAIVIALILLLPPLTDAAYVLINAAVLFTGTLVMAFVGWSRANRLLNERRSGGTN
jgi:uncharacterized membrane protein